MHTANMRGLKMNAIHRGLMWALTGVFFALCTLPSLADQLTGQVKLSCSGSSNGFSWAIVLDYDHQKVISAALGPNYAGQAPETTRWTADEIDWNWGDGGTDRYSWAVLNRNTGVLTYVFNKYRPQETFQCQKVTEQKF